MSAKHASAFKRYVVAAFTAVAAAAAVLTAHAAEMMSVTNMNALEGLAPMAALGNSAGGKAALASNFTVTGYIQSGAAKQPLLLSFPDQQQQALRDALITGVAYELADGLGSKLGPAYQATITHTPYCKNLEFTRYMPTVSDLVSFANAISRSDSDAAKFFLASETRDGTEPVSLEVQAILTRSLKPMPT